MKVEDPARLEQEEKAEEKRLAIMMMKKKEKYLYDKIMFGKKRKIREVCSNFFFFIDPVRVCLDKIVSAAMFADRSSNIVSIHFSIRHLI